MVGSRFCIHDAQDMVLVVEEGFGREGFCTLGRKKLIRVWGSRIEFKAVSTIDWIRMIGGREREGLIYRCVAVRHHLSVEFQSRPNRSAYMDTLVVSGVGFWLHKVYYTLSLDTLHINEIQILPYFIGRIDTGLRTIIQHYYKLFSLLSIYVCTVHINHSSIPPPFFNPSRPDTLAYSNLTFFIYLLPFIDLLDLLFFSFFSLSPFS